MFLDRKFLMFALAFGSAFGWTFFDFSRRRVGEHVAAVPAVVCIMLLQTLLCVPFGGLETLAHQEPRWWAFAGLSVLANAVANVLFVKAVQKAPFTLVVPLLSLTPAFAAATGWLVFGEALNPQQIAAILVVVGAALWLGWQGEGRKPVFEEKIAMIMMSITAFLWAITPFFDRACTQGETTPLTVYVGTQCLGIALASAAMAIFSPVTRAQFKGLGASLRKVAPWVLVAAIASSVGLYFQIKGVMSVSHVGLFEAVKRSLTMLMSLAIGRFILREHLTAPKIIGAAIMALGIFLLA